MVVTFISYKLAENKINGMKINEEAIDVVFYTYKLRVENISEALLKFKHHTEYAKARRRFIRKYGIKVSREKIKRTEIQNEIRKAIKTLTSRDNQTSIRW